MREYEPNRLADYSDEAILQEIRRVASDHYGGRCPQMREFDKHSMVSSGTIAKRFGSWVEAVRRAGFTPNRLTDYSDEAILEEIRRVASDHFGGRCPKIREFDKHARVYSGTVKKRFGSWTNAMRKVGFHDSRRIPVEQIEQDLRRVMSLNDGRSFTQDFYVEKGRFSPKTVKKRLGHGTWEATLRNVLGLGRPHRARGQPTRDQLFVELARVWGMLGRRPTCDEFKSKSRTSLNAYYSRFGSWTTAVEEFCSTHGYDNQGTPGTHVTKRLLEAELRVIAKKVKSGVLDYPAYKKHGGTYSIGTFQHHFGSWVAAVETVGMRHGHSGYSDENLFSELQRLWEMLGRQPTIPNLVRLGNISPSVFMKRFGSWMKAIHAFCEDRASGDEISGEDEEPEGGVDAQAEASRQAMASEPSLQGRKVPPAHKRASRNPSLRLRFQVLQHDSFRCVACGRSPATQHGLKLHVDHIRPWSKGGETVLENLQTLCEACNLGKSDCTW